MDGSHFDRLTRSLAALVAPSSRRASLRFLAGGALATTLYRAGAFDAEAKKKKGKKRKRKKKQDERNCPVSCTSDADCCDNAACCLGACCHLHAPYCHILAPGKKGACVDYIP